MYVHVQVTVYNNIICKHKLHMALHVLHSNCRIADEDYRTQVQDEEMRMTARGYNPKVRPFHVHIRRCVHDL